MQPRCSHVAVRYRSSLRTLQLKTRVPVRSVVAAEIAIQLVYPVIMRIRSQVSPTKVVSNSSSYYLYHFLLKLEAFNSKLVPLLELSGTPLKINVFDVTYFLRRPEWVFVFLKISAHFFENLYHTRLKKVSTEVSSFSFLETSAWYVVV